MTEINIPAVTISAKVLVAICEDKECQFCLQKSRKCFAADGNYHRICVSCVKKLGRIPYSKIP